mgnify:CR=1 FL=1
MQLSPLSESTIKAVENEIEAVKDIIALFPQVKEVVKKYDGKTLDTRTVHKIQKELLKVDRHLDFSFLYAHIKIEHFDNYNEINTTHCIYSKYLTKSEVNFQYDEECFNYAEQYLKSYIEKFNNYMLNEKMLLESLQQVSETYNALTKEIPTVCQRLVGVRVASL